AVAARPGRLADGVRVDRLAVAVDDVVAADLDLDDYAFFEQTAAASEGVLHIAAFDHDRAPPNVSGGISLMRRKLRGIDAHDGDALHLSPAALGLHAQHRHGETVGTQRRDPYGTGEGDGKVRDVFLLPLALWPEEVVEPGECHLTAVRRPPRDLVDPREIAAADQVEEQVVALDEAP